MEVKFIVTKQYSSSYGKGMDIRDLECKNWNFPSASIGWHISKENFSSSMIGLIIKIRILTDKMASDKPYQT